MYSHLCSWVFDCPYIGAKSYFCYLKSLLKGYFEAEEIAMEDLLEFTESEIKLIICFQSICRIFAIDFLQNTLHGNNCMYSAIWNEKKVVAMELGPFSVTFVSSNKSV